MCLPYNTIEPFLHYYAGHFQSNRFEHWELVNHAWITIRDLENPAFASAGIRWAMQYYKDRQYRQDHRGKEKSVIQSIDEEVGEGLFCKDFLTAPTDNRVEDCEHVCFLLHNTKLTPADKLLIDQRYFQSLTFKQIAKIYGCTHQNIGPKVNGIVNKLKDIAGVA